MAEEEGGGVPSRIPSGLTAVTVHTWHDIRQHICSSAIDDSDSMGAKRPLRSTSIKDLSSSQPRGVWREAIPPAGVVVGMYVLCSLVAW